MSRIDEPQRRPRVRVGASARGARSSGPGRAPARPDAAERAGAERPARGQRSRGQFVAMARMLAVLLSYLVVITLGCYLVAFVAFVLAESS